MASQHLRSIATRLLTRNPTLASSSSKHWACAASSRSFSTEEIIPGVGKGKTSTGLVGLAVDHDAPAKMITKYQALLDKMAASDMPETAAYRKAVTQIANYRIKAAKDHFDDPEMIEELCNCGQVEELVIQADDEMEVLDMYLKERWWEYVKDIEIQTESTDPAEDHGDIEWDSPIEKTVKEE